MAEKANVSKALREVVPPTGVPLAACTKFYNYPPKLRSWNLPSPAASGSSMAKGKFVWAVQT